MYKIFGPLHLNNIFGRHKTHVKTSTVYNVGRQHVIYHKMLKKQTLSERFFISFELLVQG